MNKSIINRLLMLITFVLIFSGKTGATVPVPWEVNPSAWQYDMSLYLSCRLDLDPLALDRYVVGAFVGDECRGIGKVLDNEGLSASIVSLRARSNEVSGETLSFRCFDTESGKIYEAAVEVPFEANGCVGYPSDPFEVTFFDKYAPLEAITLSSNNLTLEREESKTLIASLVPENALPVELVWTSSAPEVATVADGVVEGVANGETIITVKGGEKEAICNVTVVTPKVKVFTIAPSELSLFVGASAELTFTVEPEDAVTTIVWRSSDEKIATVVDGNVTAVAPGKAVITATTDNGLTSEASVVVNPVVAESIELDKTELTGYPGDTFTLSATLTPNNVTYPDIVWKSGDDAVVKVTDKGIVTLIAPGKAVITATTTNGLSAEVEVTVNPVLAESLDMDLKELTGKPGDTFTLKATITPENVTYPVIIWKSGNENVATVSNTGVVTFVAPGETIITASCGEVYANCSVTVSDPDPVIPDDPDPVVPDDPDPVVPEVIPVSSIALSASSWTALEGDSFILSAVVLPENATDKTLNWSSSDPAVATVDANGKVIALKPGKAVITATAADGSGVKAECSVTVSDPDPVVPDDPDPVIPDDPDPVVPDDPDPVIPDDPDPVVPDDPDPVIPDDPDPVVPEVIPVSSIALSASSWSGLEGDSFILTAAVLPENATDKTLNWSSSDPAVATVDANGKVTAAKPGTATITAAAADGSGVEAECTVTVREPEPVVPDDPDPVIPDDPDPIVPDDPDPVVPEVIPVSSIALSASSWTALEGDSFILTAAVLPENATDKTLNWSSSDPAVATVDANGKVTAVKPGKAVITATAADGSGVKAECSVTVKATAPIIPDDPDPVVPDDPDPVVPNDPDPVVPEVISVSSIALSASSWTALEGDSFILNTTVLPENATDKTLNWSSSDPTVATVDANGKVTALKPGEAVITATTADGSGVKAECIVTVKAKTPETPDFVYVTEIELSASSWSGLEGKTFTLLTQVFPENATDKSLNWSSSNTAVATVSSDGIVKAIKEGKAVITAVATDGSGVYATCDVTVAKIIYVESLVIDPEVWEGEVGSEFTITATILPANATDQALKWESSDNKVATVDNKGNVKVIGLGECMIIATAHDPSYLNARCMIYAGNSGVEAIYGDSEEKTDVYNTNGVLIKKDCCQDDLKQLTPGMYILRCGNKSKIVYLSNGF